MYLYIQHRIFNVNQIVFMVILVCVAAQRYPASLKWSKPNYLSVGCFPRPLVQASKDTGYEVVAQHGKIIRD